jgi:hypothetical protein
VSGNDRLEPVTSGVRGRGGSRDEGVRLVRSDVLVDFRTYDFPMKAGDGEDQATEGGEPESDRVVFHSTTRCCERRLPGLGLTRFRALGASVEAQLEPCGVRKFGFVLQFRTGSIPLPSRIPSRSWVRLTSTPQI